MNMNTLLIIAVATLCVVPTIAVIIALARLASVVDAEAKGEPKS